MSQGKFLESNDQQVRENQYMRTHVLIIEDDEMSASIATRFLLDLDCTVEWKSSSEHALTIFEEDTASHNYDLIFMDISLPVMDGFLLTQKIKSTQVFKNKPVPVIALTAYNDKVSRQKCFESGMEGFIEKPLMRTNACEVLQEFFPHWKKKLKKDEFHKQTEEEDRALLKEESIDFNRALKIHDGDIDFIKVSLQVIIDRLYIELEGLRLACESKDWEQSRVIIHRLRGGASYFGLMKLDNVCTAFTQILKEDPLQWKTVHPILNQEIENVRTAYQAWLNEKSD